MDPPGIDDWVCAPDPSVHRHEGLRAPVAARLPRRGPWLCVPSSRTVCLWHLVTLAGAISTAAAPSGPRRRALWTFVLSGFGRRLGVASGLERAAPAAPRTRHLVGSPAQPGDHL